MKKSISAMAEYKFVGDEPILDSDSNVSLIKCLNWYSNQKDFGDSKKYALEYAKKNGFSSENLKKLDSISEDYYKNFGFICRLKQRSEFLTDKVEYIQEKFNELLNIKVKKQEEVVEKFNSPSIQDRIYIQCNEYINEIEDCIDSWVKTKKYAFNVYEYLSKNQAKSAHANQIIDHFTPLLSELSDTINKKDEQLVEAYSYLSKTHLKTFHNIVKSIISDCQKMIDNAKITRKPRKKKAIPLEKKVAKVQYRKEEKEYKLVSINPTNIIGARQLWVFNVKYKKLGLYISSDDSGFSIKGTTIENFDEDLSIQKTVRKPLDILPIVLTGKKTELKKLLGSVNSKENPLNGRINEDTILIKAIK